MKEVDSTEQFLNSKMQSWTQEKKHSVQLQKLVDSMPNRIIDVIKSNSGSTKY